MFFHDRNDAARRLANALAEHRGRNPLILAIPRGAVPIGRVVADTLQGELDVVLVHKLRSPWNPEFAIGAIDESGSSFVSPEYAQGVEAYLQDEKARQLESLRWRRARYTPGRTSIDASGRLAIIVDDGLATGSTMIAALQAVRRQAPQRLVCAVPVAAPASLEKVRPWADEAVCLYAPEDFRAVGQFYGSFDQIDDDEVVRCLTGACAPVDPADTPSPGQ